MASALTNNCPNGGGYGKFRPVERARQGDGVGSALRGAFDRPAAGIPDDMVKILARLD